METSTTNRTLNYSFIPVPTNLFYALDVNLRNALCTLIQLSSVYADTSGYFFRTIEDLQKDFKFGKNLTIAVIESLFQYNLLQVKSVGFTKKNRTKQVNFYRVNFEHFKDFEEYNIYTIINNEELQLETVNYKAKGFKVTYTLDNVDLSPTDALNCKSEEIPSPKEDKGLESKEMTLNESQGTNTPAYEEKIEEIHTIEDKVEDDTETTEPKIDETPAIIDAEPHFNYFGVDEAEEMVYVLKEVEAFEKKDQERQKKIEIRYLPRYDNSVKECCINLVNRYAEMTIPGSNESLDKCNKAINYITSQFRKGYIDIEDKDHLIRKLIQERFKKHRI